MNNQQITKNFSFKEMLRSNAADRLKLDNTPTQTAIDNLVHTCLGMERIRAALGDLPITVNSGYRSPAVNQAVGGSKNSQHMLGEACDFVCPAFGTPTSIALHLKDIIKIIGIDQLILEQTWVHVSFSRNPRYSVLTIKDGVIIKDIL